MLLFFIRLILRIRRMTVVSRNVMNVVKGVGAGVLIGSALGMAGGWMAGCGNKKTIKKRINKATGTISDLLDNVTYMFR